MVIIHRIWFVIRVVLVTYLIVLLLMMFFEYALLFPAPSTDLAKWDAASHGAEEVLFESTDGTKLHGWYFACNEDSPRASILYCHGNGGCVGYLGSYGRWIADSQAVNFFIFDYRGYGKSEGKPREAGILADSHAARLWLAGRDKIEIGQVVVMGKSLGGAMAIDLGVNGGARAMILQSTFTSMPDVAAEHYRWIPVRLLMKTQLRSIEKIGNYRGPILLSHGDRDRVINYENAGRLRDSASGSVTFYKAIGIGHNNSYPPEYHEILDEFLDALPPLKH